MKKSVKIAILLVGVVLCGVTALAESYLHIDLSELEKEEVQKEIWQVYYQSEWESMPEKTHKSNEEYYTTVINLDKTDYEYVYVAMSEKKGEWNSGADSKYANLLIAVIKAFEDKGCNNKEYITKYFNAAYFPNGSTEREIKHDSVRLLYNYVIDGIIRFNEISKNAQSTTFGDVNVFDTNDNLKIFLQGLIYGEGFWDYCINYYASKENENGELEGSHGVVYSENIADKYFENHKEEIIGGKYNDFAKNVIKYYKSYKVNYEE